MCHRWDARQLRPVPAAGAYVLIGLFAGFAAWNYPRIRNLETEVPDLVGVSPTL